MPFPGKPISREQISTFITEGQEKTGIEFSELEKEITNKVLDELPESFNTGSLTKFCRNKVDTILAGYQENPDIITKSDVIRNYVQKEIIFYLYNEKFLEIAEAIENEKPREVNPQWIRDRFPSVSLLIRRALRDSDGNVDWSFIADKLKIKDIFTYQEKKFRDNNEVIVELKQLLGKKNPETFSPRWIEGEEDSLYSFLKTHFLDSDGNTDWPVIIETLDPEWRDKWTYKETERGRLLPDVIEKIIIVLREREPKTFGPNWLAIECNREYTFFKDHVRSADGQIGWEILVDSLPIELRNKWLASEKDRDWDYQSAIEQLRIILEAEKPETFNSTWIKSVDKGLYLYLLRNIRTEEAIDWSKIIGSLPQEWQTRWRVRWRDGVKIGREKKFSFEQAIDELKKLIQEKNPAIITSGFIGQNNPSLLSYFIRYVKDEDGEVDWRVVVSQLDIESQSKCRFPKKIKHYRPKNEYSNQGEVDKVINFHRDKLYTFFGIIGNEDYWHRDEICSELIRLVKSGNILAKEKLIDYLSILVTHWTENDEKLKPFAIHSDLLEKRIERCIYFYEDSDVPFLEYLYKSLKLEAMGLQRVNYISLNEEYKDTGETMDSRIIIP